jgi:hypothetical protein
MGLKLTDIMRENINNWIKELRTIFDVSDKSIGNGGIKLFMDNLKVYSDQITELHLANNCIGSEGMKLLFNELRW